MPTTCSYPEPARSSPYPPTSHSLKIHLNIILPSIPGDLWLFSFSLANSTSKELGSGTSGSAVCTSVCLTSLTPCTFNNWEKWFLHLAKIRWGNCNQITLLILYCISSRLVTLPEGIDALIFLMILLVSNSSNLAFRYALFLFLKCLLASHFTLFWLSTLLWLVCTSIMEHFQTSLLRLKSGTSFAVTQKWGFRST